MADISIILTENRVDAVNFGIYEGYSYSEFGAVCSDSIFSDGIVITYPGSEYLPDGTSNPYYSLEWNYDSVTGPGSVYTIHYYLDVSNVYDGPYPVITNGICSATREITVLDNPAPVIRLKCDVGYNTGEYDDDPIIVSSMSTYSDPGAISYDRSDGIEFLPGDISNNRLRFDGIDTPFASYDAVTFTSTGTLPNGLMSIGASIKITNIEADVGDSDVNVTSASTHGLSIGNVLTISNTDVFNGEYTVIGVSSLFNFTCTGTFVAGSTISESSGDLYTGSIYYVVRNNDYLGFVNEVDQDWADIIELGDVGTGVHTISYANTIESTQIDQWSDDESAWDSVNEISLIGGDIQYRIGYTVEDSSVNQSTTVYRYVNVVDTARPLLKFEDRGFSLSPTETKLIYMAVNTAYSENVSSVDSEGNAISDTIIQWASFDSGFEVVTSESSVDRILTETGSFSVTYYVYDGDASSETGYRESTYSVIVIVVDDISAELKDDPDIYIAGESYVEKGITTTGGSSPWTEYIILPSDRTLPEDFGSGYNMYYDASWDESNLHEGIYVISYLLIDSLGKESRVTREVTVNAYSGGIWELGGDSDGDMTIEAGSAWIDDGVTLIDCVGTDLSDSVTTVLPSDRYYPSSHPNAYQDNPYYDAGWDSSNVNAGSDVSKLNIVSGSSYYNYTILYYVTAPVYMSVTRKVYTAGYKQFVINLNGSSNDVITNPVYIELGGSCSTGFGPLIESVLNMLIQITVYNYDDLDVPIAPTYMQKNITLGEFHIPVELDNTYRVEYAVTTPSGNTIYAYRTVSCEEYLPTIRLL